MIEFVEDNPSRDIVCEKILSHPEEVWSIIALPAFDGGQATSATANGTDSGQLRLITGSGTASAPAGERLTHGTGVVPLCPLLFLHICTHSCTVCMRRPQMSVMASAA